MHRKKDGHWVVTEFTILEAFLVVALFGLLSGALFAVLYPTVDETAAVAPAPVAMGFDEYQVEARGLSAAFIQRATAMQTQADVEKADPSMLDLVSKTQEKLIAMERIPKEAKDGHLAFVLLLDKWKRALSGSGPDAETVLPKTKEVLALYPWFVEPSADQSPAGADPATPN